jgi:uncharacterized RDD family membrane protein YckC
VSTPGPHDLTTVPVEARGFQGQPAGLVTRLVANTIDSVVVVVVLVGSWLGWNGVKFFLDPRGFSFSEPRPAFTVTAFMVYSGIYLTLAWFVPQRTYGDHLMGLRVVGRKGRRPRFVVAAARAGFYIFFPVGLLWIVVNPNRRSIQDVVLRTAVVYDWRPRPAALATHRSPPAGEAGAPGDAGP